MSFKSKFVREFDKVVLSPLCYVVVLMEPLKMSGWHAFQIAKVVFHLDITDSCMWSKEVLELNFWNALNINKVYETLPFLQFQAALSMVYILGSLIMFVGCGKSHRNMKILMSNQSLKLSEKY